MHARVCVSVCVEVGKPGVRREKEVKQGQPSEKNMDATTWFLGNQGREEQSPEQKHTHTHTLAHLLVHKAHRGLSCEDLSLLFLIKKGVGVCVCDWVCD